MRFLGIITRFFKKSPVGQVQQMKKRIAELEKQLKEAEL
jgi:hypothetical protein